MKLKLMLPTKNLHSYGIYKKILEKVDFFELFLTAWFFFVDIWDPGSHNM